MHRTRHFQPRQLAQLRPELEPLLGEYRDLRGHAQPAQLAVSSRGPDKRRQLLTLVVRLEQILVERHHRVVPLGRRDFLEVLFEPCLRGRPVGDGERQLHELFCARIVHIAQLIRRPRRVERRIPFEREAIGDVRAAVWVVRQEWESAALECQSRGMLRPIVREPMFHWAGRVHVDEHGTPLLESLQYASNEMRRRGLRRLVDIHTAVCNSDVRKFFAHFLLAMLRLAPGRHVRHLPGVSRGAGLTAGVGIHLRVEHHHAERLPTREQAREILEPDIEHRTVATHRHDRWAEREFVVREL